MEPITFIPDVLYSDFYVGIMALLCLLVCLIYFPSNNSQYIYSKNIYSKIGAFLLILMISLFIGLRPVSALFGDMPMYAHTYNNIIGTSLSEYSDERNEWAFYGLGLLCKTMEINENGYFLIISLLYFGLTALVCWRLMRSNMLVAIIFFLVSFSTYSYGTNGLRNGLACSIVLLAITFLSKEKWKVIISLLLMFIALNIHRSTLLPSLCAIVAVLFVKDTKWAISFWIASIFISLFAGNYITEFFIDLGFDERMESYANLDELGEVKESANVKAGFRFDFIIYSIMPIIMAWYVTIKRNFKDRMFNIIANTYILANAFWIMVIRSEQSNRFAYLSWFIYPIVIAYPLLRMNIWEDQDRKLATILFLYSSFTVFMHFIYYGV